MTVIYAQEFIQGIALIADSRASVSDGKGGYNPWRDNTQKLFRLGDWLFISFCGDIEFAGSVIQFLARQIKERPQLANPTIFDRKGPKLIKFAYESLALQTGRTPSVGFIVAGMDYGRPEPLMEGGKVTGYIRNLFDKHTFKLSSPDFAVTKANFFKSPILALGSGAPLVQTLENDFKELYNFGGLGKNVIDYRAMLISGSIKQRAEEMNETSVGGLFQIVVIDEAGSRFIPYKTRSSANKDPQLLDLEMALRDGRWVQKDLKTGKEIALLYPPEVIRVKEDSPDLFALLAQP